MREPACVGAYAFGTLGANEVIAFTERNNTRSRAVMERLGMEYVDEFPGEGGWRA